LVALTLACLLPFSGRAFHTDDTLFVWVAQRISQHPLDPYGFTLNWQFTTVRMSELTQNPPLASYYLAAWAKFVGWSERALHLAFLLPALACVLGTYRLAGRFTRSPLLAAIATLVTPALLVSACSTMCDPLMLALWIWATVFWIEGLNGNRPILLAISAFLVTASELTKYFGAALILLLFAYTLARNRRIGSWVGYLLVPAAVLIGYEFATARIYGHGLITTAIHFSQSRRLSTHSSKGARVLVGLSYTGGCALPAIFLAPLLWSRKQITATLVAAGAAAALMMRGVVRLGAGAGSAAEVAARNQSWAIISAQLVLFLAGGIGCLALAVADYRRRREADSLLLLLWILGTFWFTAFLNWTMNARSLLPMIPAVGILLARRLEYFAEARMPRPRSLVAAALVLSGALSWWLARADSEAANAARTAASTIHRRTSAGAVWFAGHSGFQYYMQRFGARPYDWWHPQIKPGDWLAAPYSIVWPNEIAYQFPGPREDFAIPMHASATTNSPELSAGFYYSYWSVLPYAFGPVPADKYAVVRLGR